MIIYSKASGFAEGALGRLDTPIKMLIENESDLMKKKGGVCDWLFNKEKSTHFAETIMLQSGFDTFEYVPEGSGAVSDRIRETTYGIIEHLQFMKEFTITAEMMEDANMGIATEAKRRIQNFVRSYYYTINKACSLSLTEATKEYFEFNGGTICTRSTDNFPLFSNCHTWGIDDKAGTQCNLYSGNFTKVDNKYSIEKIEDNLYKLSGFIRNMKDENGDPTGYVADTIILPGNKPRLEQMVKKICGSENVVASANNDINLHYGNWNIIVLPFWNPVNDDMIVMSSEANRALSGNIFFERVPLTVSSWIDHHTGNYNWTGRCRFGIGFGSYKHIVRVSEGTDFEYADALPD